MIRETLDAFWAGALNLRTRLKTELEGVTALEYALIAALIAAVIIVAVAFAGREVSGTFSCVGDRVGGGSTASC